MTDSDVQRSHIAVPAEQRFGHGIAVLKQLAIEVSMSNINRRGLLSSLAATAVCAGTNPGRGGTRNQAAINRSALEAEHHGTWYIVRQNPQAGDHIVDFWSKPFCEVPHADHLPAGITRGVLWYTNDCELYVNPADAIEEVSLVIGQPSTQWLDNAGQHLEHFDGTSSLSLPLSSLLGKKGAQTGRTALIALDSQSYSPMEPDWDEVIPALRQCYDRIIGHIHIERRGFLHWKEWLSRGDGGPAFFDHVFSTPASLCDAVVVTCPSILEQDLYLSVRKSTETLAAELIGRLGRVLLDPATLELIAPMAKPLRKARAFVLGSVTSTTGRPAIDMRNLCRQRELVFGGFGRWDRQYTRPLLIATRADDRSINKISSPICRTTDIAFSRVANSDRLAGDDPLEPIEMVMLWPFETDLPLTSEPGLFATIDPADRQS